MLISFHKTSDNCSFEYSAKPYLPLDNHNGVYSIRRNKYHQDSEYYLPCGLEFSIPFTFSTWKAVTQFNDSIKIYYFISVGSSTSLFPIYVTEYINRNCYYSNTNQQNLSTCYTSFLLNGMNKWYSFYFSRNMSTLTFRMMYIKELLSNWSDELPYNLDNALSMLIQQQSNCDLYIPNDLFNYNECVDELQKLYYRCIQNGTYFNHSSDQLQMFPDTWEQLQEIMTPRLNKSDSCDLDYMLRYAPMIDGNRLRLLLGPIRTSDALPQSFLLNETYLTSNYHASDFPIFLQNDILARLATYLLYNGVNHFKASISSDGYEWEDFNTVRYIRELPDSRPNELNFLVAQLQDIIKQNNLDKINFWLNHDNLHICPLYKDSSIDKIYTYNFVLHMLGPVGNVVVDERTSW